LSLRGRSRIWSLVQRLWRTHIDWGSSDARPDAACVVRADGEGFEFRVWVFGVVERCGAVGTDSAGGYVAGCIAEDEALDGD
jgi:hypothetical protein